jgi:hypothetical protein
LSACLFATADPTADIRKRTAATIKDNFLPNRLLIYPAMAPPITHPTSAPETVNPRSEFDAASVRFLGRTK